MRILLKQFIKFGIVGVSNTLISLAVYYLLVFLGMHYLIAHAIAFVLSVLNAYYWNRKYVFDSAKQNTKNQLVKIYIAYGATFLLSLLLLFLMIDILDISHLIAPLINLAITVPLNFLLNKFWVFRQAVVK